MTVGIHILERVMSMNSCLSTLRASPSFAGTRGTISHTLPQKEQNWVQLISLVPSSVQRTASASHMVGAGALRLQIQRVQCGL